MNNNRKRIVILGIYLAVIVLIGATIYFMFKSDPTCYDGIRNQGETGIDCGGPCSPCQKRITLDKLKVESVEMADDGKGGKDVLIKIYNPNEEYGARSFQYVLVDDLGNRSKVYTDFILPKETKYVIVNDYFLNKQATTVSVGINNEKIDWRQVVNYDDPKLVVANKRFQKATEGVFYAKIIGLLTNKSGIDYETIKIKGVLRDENGVFLGASYQIINTLPANEKREFQIVFPNNLKERVHSVEVQPETNIFKSDNYLKIKGRGNNLDM